MDNDDKPIGQILSRRDALKVLGIGSAAFLAACASPEETSTVIPTQALKQVSSTQAAATVGTVLDCVVRPELTIGPYFVDEQLERSDIRVNSSDNSIEEGVPLTLNINVASVSENSCTPIEGAQEDYQFTSQFFSDDTLTDQVHALEPYASKGQRDIRNANDNIFSGDGDQLLLSLQGDTTNGFTGSMSIGLDLTDVETGASDINSAGGSPPL